LKRISIAVDKPSRDHSVSVNFTVSVVVGLLLKRWRPGGTSAHVQTAVHLNVCRHVASRAFVAANIFLPSQRDFSPTTTNYPAKFSAHFHSDW